MVMAYIIPLILCLPVYGLAWVTGIGSLGEFSISQIFVFAVAGVFINCIAAAGEEIGWRGFLLTELRQIVPVRLASVIIGIVWFLYHAPLILFSDYNNGNIPYSLLCFFIMVMGFTLIASWLCIKARSFWPAVLLHASHNVFVQSIFDSITVTGKYTRLFTSEFGMGLAIAYIGFAIAGFLIFRNHIE
ncbi:MAG: CPBP family intramembrane glutamic endopeptidase [Anaerovoracaceae bacterium]